MRQKFVLIVFVCLFLTVKLFGQPETGKLKSADVFGFSIKIAEQTSDQIWTGFDVRRYISLKSNSESNNINFNSEPDNPKAGFSWQLADDYFLSNSLEDNLVITFHEAFHAFERDPKRAGGKWLAENSMLVFEYAETSARNNALFNIEGQILFSALKAGNQNELKEKILQFLIVRQLRQSELDARFIEFEKGAESNEGLAEYAGTKAVISGMEAVKNKKLSMSFTGSDSRRFLLGKFEKLNSITNAGRNMRLKFYYTGSAQGFLLDRLRPDWKKRVQMDGAALQDLLTEAVNQKALKKQPPISEILRDYNYEKILQAEESAVAERKAANQSLLDSTINQKGLKFIIDFSALSAPGQVQSFDPMNVTMVAPKIRVHTRMVNFAGRDSFKAGFTQPVVEDLEAKRYITVVPGEANIKITADGEEIDAKKSIEKRFQTKLTITTDNFTFEAQKGEIKISENEVIIKILGN